MHHFGSLPYDVQRPDREARPSLPLPHVCLPKRGERALHGGAFRCQSIHHQIRHIDEETEHHDDAFPTCNHLLFKEPAEDEQHDTRTEHNGIVKKGNALYTQRVNRRADTQYQKDIEQVRTDHIPDRHLGILFPCRYNRGG